MKTINDNIYTNLEDISKYRKSKSAIYINADINTNAYTILNICTRVGNNTKEKPKKLKYKRNKTPVKISITRY